MAQFYATTERDPTLMEPVKFSKRRWVSIEAYTAGEPWSAMNPAAYQIFSEYLMRIHPYNAPTTPQNTYCAPSFLELLSVCAWCRSVRMNL